MKRIVLLLMSWTTWVEAQDLLPFDPEQGFSPAQPSLAMAFLKLAGSLEHYGSPEPYLRHVLAEHERVSAKGIEADGKFSSTRPDYFTQEYLTGLLAGWKSIEKPLQLEQLCRDCGRYMRHAIRGSWHKSVDELVIEETKLTEEQRKRYRALLQKTHFKKSDFAALESFHEKGGGFGSLSKVGKAQVSHRALLGTMPPEEREKFREAHEGGTKIVKILNGYQRKLIADINEHGERRVTSETLEGILIKELSLEGRPPEIGKLSWDEQDAVRYAHLVKWEFTRRLDLVSKQLDRDALQKVEGQMMSMVRNLFVLAHSEVLASMRERQTKE